MFHGKVLNYEFKLFIGHRLLWEIVNSPAWVAQSLYSHEKGLFLRQSLVCLGQTELLDCSV